MINFAHFQAMDRHHLCLLSTSLAKCNESGEQCKWCHATSSARLPCGDWVDNDFLWIRLALLSFHTSAHDNVALTVQCNQRACGFGGTIRANKSHLILARIDRNNRVITKFLRTAGLGFAGIL